ncbi:MAG: acetyl-CoA acetyltransferase [Bradyrhizobium sp.]|jgi:acetyl-CoA C-acetyltransferase|uniref:Thiolase domain-containing protein n=1 Tax=Caenimonas koreensis DSM 17982 TaxID=1121255 RepID=A0A844B999_9BURK|nr:acetyl-CoA acetyltransferase [Caenimonas koreensis]ART89968.1 3-ketoacyl-CoA thiolase [uncultured bacterium]MRD49702.1 thiolase domain-containing protein [Caenimonas koreensis DSM 17982]
MNPCIVGWAHTKFGRLGDETVESLMVRVTREALDDARVSGADVDGIFVGLFNNGFSEQDFPSSLPFHANESLRFKPATRYENACATGSAAIHGALDFIAAGRGRIALVVGAEKMTDVSTAGATQALRGASYLREEAAHPAGFAGVFGDIAAAYFDRWGDHYDALARIAVKNHANALHNPYAQFQRELDLEFCLRESPGNPLIAAPLKRTDCSPISDGAAAVVIAHPDVARTSQKAVAFRSTAHVNDFLPASRRERTRLEGASIAWQRAFEASAGLSLRDLHFVESHDCFTIAELMEYEAMGLTPPGRAHVALDEGWVYKGGKLPINPSGGLKAKGHPIGATGVSMHALAAMQLCGQAAGMQIDGASVGGVFNMGGLGVANYVSILERQR